jgi:hypothetical protein
MHDQEVIQAFSSHASQKAFTDSICLWRSIRCSKHLDVTRCRYACETRPEFAIIIPNEIFWRLPIRSRLPQLLCHPEIRRRAGHIYMNHPPRLQFDEEKGKKRTEEEVRDLQKITGPYLCRMIAQEDFPALSTGSFWANLLDILLDSPFTHLNIQLEELTSNALRPQSRLFAAISLINLIVSCESLGLLERAFDVCLQNTRKSSRCQRRSVSGWTIKSACFQVRTILARNTRSTRSVFR